MHVGEGCPFVSPVIEPRGGNGGGKKRLCGELVIWLLLGQRRRVLGGPSWGVVCASSRGRWKVRVPLRLKSKGSYKKSVRELIRGGEWKNPRWGTAINTEGGSRPPRVCKTQKNNKSWP